MALGATSRTLPTLVVSQSARPVGFGLVLGAASRLALGAVLLATPAAERSGRPCASSIRSPTPLACSASSPRAHVRR